MTLSPEEAFNLLCNGILKPHNTNVDGLINLFCGQISSAHINQTADQLFQTLQEATSLRINTMQISRNVQLIRILHTLLSCYRPECVDELFKSCVINVVPGGSREIYLWVPQDLADLLLQLHANGMYTGRNVLFVSDSENGRDNLRTRLNAIPSARLPGNVAKSPLVIALATPHKPRRSKKIATNSNTQPSSANTSSAGIDPRRKSHKPSVGKKEPRSEKDLTVSIGTNPAATTRLLAKSQKTGSNALPFAPTS